MRSRVFLAVLLLTISCFSDPSLACFKLDDPEGRVELFLCSTTDNYGIRVQSQKGKLYTFSFFLKNPITGSPPFESSVDAFRTYLQLNGIKENDIERLTSELTDKKVSWPKTIPKQPSDTNDYSLIRTFIVEKAQAWEKQWRPYLERMALREALEKQATTIFLESPKVVHWTEKKEDPPGDIAPSKVLNEEKIHASSLFSSGFYGSDGRKYMMDHPPISATEGWVRMMERRGRNYWPPGAR